MAKEGGSARSCEMCLRWSVLRWTRTCHGCRAWKRTYPERGVCPRCRHEGHLNTDGLCKSCLQAIRAFDDAEWALGVAGAAPRDVQLIVGAWRDYATRACKLVRASGSGRGTSKTWRTKLRHQDRDPAGAEVLAPGLRGQLALFTAPRTLTEATVRAIIGRPLAGWDRAREVLVEMAAEYGMSEGWYYQVAEMVRLALAVNEAEGTGRLHEARLRDLPTHRDAVRLILLQAGLLEAAPVPMRFSRADQPARIPYITAPVPIPPLGPRQCRECHDWIPAGARGFRCTPCRHWRERHPRGRCVRCSREDLPLRADRCRPCHPYRLLDEARPATSRFTQLVIVLPTGGGGPVLPVPVDDPPADNPDESPAGLTARGQEALFTLRRDWAPVLDRLRRRPRGELPLTARARLLVEEYSQMRREQQAPDYRKNIRTLTTVMYWLGADSPVSERDVHDLAQLDPNLAAKPVCQFLRARDLLVDDPDLHRDPDLTAIEAALAALPQPTASEVRAWVDILRSQGRREGELRGWDGIRRYLDYLQPVLTGWAATGVTTLREISQHQVEDAVRDLSGHARRQLAIALRSLFRALKRQRVVFRDPARELPVGDLKGIPRSVPSDLLARLLDHARTPVGRLAVALAAVHAVPGRDMRMILTADVDLARGTVEIRRGLLRHTLYLEEFTHRLAAEWLTYRHHRWPGSTNPHLLVSQKSALDPDQPAISIGALRGVLPKGMTLDDLRQDRILDEAFEGADPLRLMRLFGITERTAMRYVGAAHPERTSKLPR
ncbi:hypothetical protein ACIGDI_40050 [Streptomyces sp. NPDC085900]|uniref:hypothetical protein n=1 Tax=Streptomyces sp. NPDC085900 TaxID=3365737 RepID=UPI0037D45A35